MPLARLGGDEARHVLKCIQVKTVRLRTSFVQWRSFAQRSLTSEPVIEEALIRPSATFSHARAREKALNGYCLLPSEGWEKVPDRADEGMFAGMTELVELRRFRPGRGEGERSNDGASFFS